MFLRCKIVVVLFVNKVFVYSQTINFNKLLTKKIFTTSSILLTKKVIIHINTNDDKDGIFI
jgi:hypothetical protein